MRSFKDNRGRITAISVGWFHKISGEYYILGFEILVTASEVGGKKGEMVWKGRVGDTRVSDRMPAADADLGMMFVVTVSWFAWARRRWTVPVRLFDVTRFV